MHHFIRIHTKSHSGLFCAETHPPSKFHENLFSSFCVILVTNQQNVTSLVLVVILHHTTTIETHCATLYCANPSYTASPYWCLPLTTSLPLSTAPLFGSHRVLYLPRRLTCCFRPPQAKQPPTHTTRLCTLCSRLCTHVNANVMFASTLQLAEYTCFAVSQTHTHTHTQTYIYAMPQRTNAGVTDKRASFFSKEAHFVCVCGCVC